MKCYTDHDRPPQDPPFPVCPGKTLGDYCDGESDCLFTNSGKFFCQTGNNPSESSTGNVVLGSGMIVLGVAITTGNGVLGSFIMIFAVRFVVTAFLSKKFGSEDSKALVAGCEDTQEEAIKV